MDAFKEADILATNVVAGEVRVNLGRGSTGKGVASEISIWGPDGYIAVPNTPDDDGYAQAMYLQEGDRLRVLATRDNRFADLAGDLKPGDRAVVSDCDARFFLKREHNSVTLYSVNEEDNDKSMMVHVGGATGEILVLNGGAKIVVKTDRIELIVNGGGALIIDKDGVHASGNSFNADTGSTTLGLVGGVRPVPGITSAIIGLSGQTGVPSATVTVAP